MSYFPSKENVTTNKTEGLPDTISFIAQKGGNSLYPLPWRYKKDIDNSYFVTRNLNIVDYEYWRADPQTYVNLIAFFRHPSPTQQMICQSCSPGAKCLT